MKSCLQPSPWKLLSEPNDSQQGVPGAHQLWTQIYSGSLRNEEKGIAMLIMSYLNSSPDYPVMKSLPSTLPSLYLRSSVKSTTLIKYNTDYQIIHRRQRNSCINLKVLFLGGKKTKISYSFFYAQPSLIKKLRCILMRGCWLISGSIQGCGSHLVFHLTPLHSASLRIQMRATLSQNWSLLLFTGVCHCNRFRGSSHICLPSPSRLSCVCPFPITPI